MRLLSAAAAALEGVGRRSKDAGSHLGVYTGEPGIFHHSRPMLKSRGWKGLPRLSVAVPGAAGPRARHGCRRAADPAARLVCRGGWDHGSAVAVFSFTEWLRRGPASPNSCPAPGFARSHATRRATLTFGARSCTAGCCINPAWTIQGVNSIGNRRSV